MKEAPRNINVRQPGTNGVIIRRREKRGNSAVRKKKVRERER